MFLDIEMFVFIMGYIKLVKCFNVIFSTGLVGMSRIVNYFVLKEGCLFG